MYKVPPHIMLEPSAGSIDKYYSDQVGGNLPVYAGRHQAGHGLFRSLISGAAPLMKNIAKPLFKKLGRTLLSKGKKRAKRAVFGIARDVLGGGNVKKAAKRRGLQFLGIKKANKKGRKRVKRVSKTQAGGKRRARRKKNKSHRKVRTIFG
jgi:hypothetical protein